MTKNLWPAFAGEDSLITARRCDCAAAGRERRSGEAAKEQSGGGENMRAGNASPDIEGIKGGPLSLGSEWPVIIECLAT